MNARHEPITVALLAAPAVTGATLYGVYDALASVRRDWAMLHGGGEVDSPFRPLVVSRDGGAVEGANGVRLVAQASFAECPAPQVACITDLALPPHEPPGDRYAAEVAWLGQCHANGALVASSCSGAVLLAQTGLLDDEEATSHWAYCDVLARRHPRTRWHPERGLVHAGRDGRILMSGSGIAWHMLALALISRFAGPEAALQVARINLIDLNEASPLAYASLTRRGFAPDPVIARCQQWVAEHYASEVPVARMVELSGLPERTFKRRFAQATGMSPLDYVHVVRLEEAKQLLESGDLPIEAVAEAVGYQDKSFFGRLFRRKVTLTPAQYRRRFARLGQRLRPAS